MPEGSAGMARIVVVGSVAADEVVRLSEPVRVGAHLEGRATGHRLGGGGANTAVALVAAGHQVSLVTAVGDDAAGAWQLAELAAAGVDTSQIARVAGPSTRSIVMIDPEGERTIVNLGRVREAGPPRRLLDLPADLVYVRTRSTDLAPLLAKVARAIPVIAHVPPLGEGIAPSHIVLGSASDLSPAVLADPLAAARRVAGERLHWMVLTQGAQGARALPTAGKALAVAAPKVAAKDSTGAGDAFAAGLCHGLGAGKGAVALDESAMAAALAEAVRWGSEKVRHDGSALPAAVVRALVKGASVIPA